MNEFKTHRRRIGLFGGSFNPAHNGHLEISQAALKTCGLNEIWWLVSPQNPLKTTKDMDLFSSRVESVRALIGTHPRIKIKTIEKDLGISYSVETIRYLTRRYHNCSFLWVMGADNLLHIHEWKEWQTIFRTLPIVIFDRPGYTYRALKAKAAQSFSKDRRAESHCKMLVKEKAPAWLYLHGRLNPISATAIRLGRKKV